MGHSLLNNIRQGDWLIDYTKDRIASQLDQMPRLLLVLNFLTQAFDEVRKLPG